MQNTIQLAENISHLVLYGDDDFQIELTLRQLREQMIDPAMGALGHRVENNPNVADVMEALGAVSFSFGNKSVLELHQPGFMEKAIKDDGDPKQAERIITALQETISAVDPSQKCCIWVIPKLDSRLKLPKWLLAQPFVKAVKFESFKFWETEKAENAVAQMAKSKGIAIDSKAIEALVICWGVGLRQLYNELEKLATYANGQTITVEAVKQLSIHHDNLFAMVDAWILAPHGSPAKAHMMATLHECLLSQHPTPLFALIQTYLGNLFRAGYYASKGNNSNTIGKLTNQKPFKVEKDLEKIRGVSLHRLYALRQKVLEMEWKTKTGQLDGILALETLLAS